MDEGCYATDRDSGVNAVETFTISNSYTVIVGEILKRLVSIPNTSILIRSFFYLVYSSLEPS